jgi:hypothetical protein
MMKRDSFLDPFVAGGRHAVGPLLWCALLALGLVWSGCSSSTEPEGDDGSAEFQFSPNSQGQEIFLSDSLDFGVTIDPPAAMDVTWWRNRTVAGNAATYRYFPVAVGQDTIAVRAAAGTYSDSTYWVVKVLENPSLVPPQVPGINVLPGPRPAEVELQWSRVAGAAFPIVEYQAAVSFTGPITAQNWGEARILGTYPAVPGQVGYGKIFTEADDGMVPGATAWFAVRALDSYDQLSTQKVSVSHDITFPWFVEGVVSDDRGRALLGIIVDSLEPPMSDNTDGTGFYRLGPFRNIDSVRVQTTSRNEDLPGEPLTSWYDYRSSFLTHEEPDLDIVLITRYVTDERCWASNPGGLFLPFFRSMTRTKDDPANPEYSILHRWETYPLTVYVPEFTNDDQVRMDLGAVAALEFWNNAMGEEYFVRTNDPVSADINFLFTGGIDYGEVTLLLPAGPDIRLGRVVPEKMQVFINTILSTEKLVTEVTLHELGHALGHLAHNPCGSGEYLMFTGGGTGALDNIDPIHLDERRLVNVIRRLPQGVDMSHYLLD